MFQDFIDIFKEKKYTHKMPPILDNFKAPLITGTGTLELLLDYEDLIIEETQESSDQNHPKVT